MASSIVRDWREEKVIFVLGANVELEIEDKTERILLTDDQFHNLFDVYREYINEPTINDLENKILSLESFIEELKNTIELHEEC